MIFFSIIPEIKIERTLIIYTNGAIHTELLKNDDVIKAISGSFALHGIKVVVVIVMILSLWLSIVRAAITPGTPQPVPIIIGINDFPERPNLLSILSVINAILDI